ncbi:MAG: class I SAM-dependent methyltransferase [Thermomicrobiaceae bacterium]
MTEPQQAQPPNPAEMYERVLVSQLFRPLSREVLNVAPPRTGDRILDLACGTGIVLREAAALNGSIERLVGIDLNPHMVAVARTIDDETGLSIDYHEAPADVLPFADSEFTRVYCQQGLQFFPDRVAAIAETHRVLEAGGQAVMIVWRSLEEHPYLNQLNEIAYKHTGFHMLADPFSFGDEQTLRSLFENDNYRDVQIEQVNVETVSDDPKTELGMMLMGATAAIPSMQDLNQEQRAELVETVVSNAEPIINQFSVNGVVTTEWHANVAIATK